jgi:hypothetical protein
MESLIVSLFALVLIVATSLLHYEALRLTSDAIPKLRVPARARILVVIAGCFVAHLLEIALYAIVFASLQNHWGMGGMSGSIEGGPLDFYYLSLSSYTTLGIGDIYPTGPLRVIAGIEALNGLVLIGWSASFTYLAMERFWQLHRRPAAR